MSGTEPGKEQRGKSEIRPSFCCLGFLRITESKLGWERPLRYLEAFIPCRENGTTAIFRVGSPWDGDSCEFWTLWHRGDLSAAEALGRKSTESVSFSIISQKGHFADK